MFDNIIRKNRANIAFGIIISAPSGTGKTTIINNISKILDNIYCSVSTTTRKPRNGEEDGKDYYFTDKENFDLLLKQDKFLEYDVIYDNFYGTNKDEINKAITLNKNIIFDISWIGAKKILDNLDSISIYLIPPSFSELKQRLLNRGQDNYDIIDKRLKMAKEEIKQANNYDYIIINENIEETTNLVQKIIEVERAKRQRFNDLLQDLSSDIIEFAPNSGEINNVKFIE